MVACGLEYLLVFGGRAATNLDDLYLYELCTLLLSSASLHRSSGTRAYVASPFFSATNKWKAIHAGGRIPTARHFHSACFYKNAMYLFGGISGKLGSLEDLCRLVMGSSHLKNPIDTCVRTMFRI
jgi:hypothetical protein